MEIVYIIVGTFIGLSLFGIGTMLYEYIRYHSGIFKPKYTEEEIDKKINFYESSIIYSNEVTQIDSDNLDFWLDQKKIMERYKKLHKL